MRPPGDLMLVRSKRSAFSAALYYCFLMRSFGESAISSVLINTVGLPQATLEKIVVNNLILYGLWPNSRLIPYRISGADAYGKI